MPKRGAHCGISQRNLSLWGPNALGQVSGCCSFAELIGKGSLSPTLTRSPVPGVLQTEQVKVQPQKPEGQVGRFAHLIQPRPPPPNPVGRKEWGWEGKILLSRNPPPSLTPRAF